MLNDRNINCPIFYEGIIEISICYWTNTMLICLLAPVSIVLRIFCVLCLSKYFYFKAMEFCLKCNTDQYIIQHLKVVGVLRSCQISNN